MKDFFISDAAQFENQSVTSYFLLSSLTRRDRKDGGQYLALTLADKSGQFEARMWEEFASVLQTCSDGCYVKAQGQVSKYQGKFQITISKMRSAADSEIDRADFVPTTVFDIGAMNEELRGYVAAFRNPHLKRLVFSFLDHPEIGPAFLEAPAAKKLHHAWIGGLLEHVVSLVRVSRSITPYYPEADPDLVAAGAILHDIGKTRELSWGSSFQYTLEGQLVGHITIGLAMLRDRVVALDREAKELAALESKEPALFPPALLLMLEHLILSHHGKLEFGSPKLPMTPEAILFSALDDLEAKFQTLRTEIAAARQAGKSAGETTEWVRSMERPLFDSRAYLRSQTATVDEAPESTPEPQLELKIESSEELDAESIA